MDVTKGTSSLSGIADRDSTSKGKRVHIQMFVLILRPI